MSTATVKALSKFQKRNLLKLAIGLRTVELKTEFDMSELGYRHSIAQSLPPSEIKNECGTACCALGHGPIFCSKPKREEDWDAYANRCFVNAGDEFLDDPVTSFLFSGGWPNDKEQFSARVVLVLRNLVPPIDDYDYLAKYPVPRIKTLESLLQNL